ncbi:MAG: hypothetical protein HP052_02875 [Firmicutes bacterium]|nr:hypothetical protein [Bacillota bacterium]
MKKILISVAIILTMTAMVLGGCADNNATNDNGNSFSRGVVTDNVYASQYSGLTFTLPSDWVYASDEEMASLMNTSVDLLNNAGIEASQEEVNAITIYDMIARDPASGTNVIILYENLALSQGGLAYSAEDYLKASNAMLEQTGYYDNFSEISERTISGDTYVCQNITGNMNGMTTNQYYFARRIDDYMLSIIVSLFGTQYDLESITANFS